MKDRVTGYKVIELSIPSWGSARALIPQKIYFMKSGYSRSKSMILKIILKIS
jgi:hypothetical protein